MSLDFNREHTRQSLLRDTRTTSEKLVGFLSKPENGTGVIVMLTAIAFVMPAIVEIALLIAGIIAFASWQIQKQVGLPMRIPMSANMTDPNEVDVASGKSKKGEGIIFLGNDQQTNEEIWASKTQATTHMLFMGTTGGGKAQSLRSRVLTPSGWRRMGELAVGDLVCIPDGKTAQILGIHPQGVKRMYIFQLANGEKVEACDEHLWAAKFSTDGVKWGERIGRTDEMIQCVASGQRIKVPVVKVQEQGATVAASEQAWVEVKSIKKGSMQPAQCIKVDSTESLYITQFYKDNKAASNDAHQIGVVTHNTEYLISVVYNALIHASGFIYVDGKADNKLYGKILALARSRGREDDIRVINFQTGARDIFGAQPVKMSNTMNPYSVGSSGMLTEMIKGLMSTGKSDIWSQRAESFVEALLKPLVFLRDRYSLMLDVTVIRDYFELSKLEELAWRAADSYPGLDETLDGLKAYLINLPAYDRNKLGKQGDTTNEQHGYITMQLIKTFGAMSDVYGYIMRTPLAEVDFLDVVLNRRILVVLLPALEKSAPELANLGRITVSALKAVMATGLGADIEGEWRYVIDAKPTEAPSPFMAVLDEYGLYAVEGFSVVPAQARSLGFCAIFAGQDLPAFQKASKEEAESILANTRSKFCGALECTKTYEYFRSLAGQGFYTRVGSYESTPSSVGGAYVDSKNTTIDRYDRVSLDELKSQITGQWHLFFSNKIVRVKSFFANPPKVKILRTNHFIPVFKPNKKEQKQLQRAEEAFIHALEDGFSEIVETPPIYDLTVLAEGLEKHREKDPVRKTIAAMHELMLIEKARFEATMTSLAKEPTENQETFDASGTSSMLDDFDFVGAVENFDKYGQATPPDKKEPKGLSKLDLIRKPGNEKANKEEDWWSDDVFDSDENQVRDRLFKAEDVRYFNGMSVYGTTDMVTAVTGSGESVGDGQGLIDRDTMEDGLAKIEQAIGASTPESQQTASAIANKIAEATKYPTIIPKSNPTVDMFKKRAVHLVTVLDKNKRDSEAEDAGDV